MRRRNFVGTTLLLLSGCSADSSPDRATPTTAAPVETTCDDSAVVLEATKPSLTPEQMKWIHPIAYVELSPTLQKIADRIVQDGVHECSPPSEGVDEFINSSQKMQEKQASEYLEATSSSSLPWFVDSGFLQKDSSTYALFIKIEDVIISSGEPPD